MKVKIDYLIRVKKEVEVTPEEYCRIHVDCHSRPDIFPEEAFDCNISYDVKDMKELEDYLQTKQSSI